MCGRNQGEQFPGAVHAKCIPHVCSETRSGTSINADTSPNTSNKDALFEPLTELAERTTDTELMSFKDLEGGRGAGVRGTVGFSGNASNPQSDILRTVEGSIFKVASSVQSLKRLVDVLNTPKDTVDHRRRIGDLNSTIQRLAKSIKDSLTAALHEGASQPSEMQSKGRKLLSDFAAILQASDRRP